jgi:hypothetical protein
MAYDTRLFRDRSMRQAYAFAKDGNALWAYQWLNQAYSYLPPSERQLKKFRKLLREATNNVPTLVASEAAVMETEYYNGKPI